MRLSELETNQSAIIVRVHGKGLFRKRINEMGFIRGRKIHVVKNAPLKDPVEYSIMGYNVSLRRAEASKIEVSQIPSDLMTSRPLSDLKYDFIKDSRSNSDKVINIALIGNPNSGKTSIFNQFTRSTEHVGNYSGVTVDIKVGKVDFQGYTFFIFDLPGTYSLSSYSPDELFVRNFLNENSPDVILNVVDSTNLERNLYLTTQLIELNQKMVIALNMYDEFKSSGNKFNHLQFGSLLGVPVVPTVGSRGRGFARLFDTIIKKHNQEEKSRKKVHVNYGPDLEESISRIFTLLKESGAKNLQKQICLRHMTVKLLEGDEAYNDLLISLQDGEKVKKQLIQEQESIVEKYKDEPESVFTDYRYGFIQGALKETFSPSREKGKDFSWRIDNILTHRYLGIPVFFVFLWLIFTATFKLGQYPVAWIETGVAFISEYLNTSIPDGDLKHLLVDGVIGGVGGIIVFLPNILILFFFISFMEDTGYMARAAFIMDKVMHKIGLHGKSFIPLVMGFGCNVPAIMSTRIIESRNNRLLTMLIIPFMSCSARLPVYILIISAFFPSNQGSILFGIYLTGILLAVFSALLFKRIFFRTDDSPFVMELPPYRLPTLKNTTRHMWGKAYQYLKKIGGVILIASIIIWGLNYYPTNSIPFKGQNEKTENTRDSYLESIGKTLEPVMAPLGFDWRITVSLLAGIPAKEIVVSTMGVIYEADDKNPGSLGDRLREERYETGPNKGKQVYTPAVALAFLMFILIYFPCIAVVATTAKESGSFYWAIVLIVYTTLLAWFMSFIVFNLINFFT